MKLRNGKFKTESLENISPANINFPAEIWVNILASMESTDLRKYRAVSSTWNKEAVKILTKRKFLMKEPNYKDREWFDREASSCQVCNKQYEDPAQACNCITNEHKRLRCYICFRSVEDTEALGEHYISKHRADDKRKTIKCPYCDITLNFKSISCHVISVHLMALREEKKAEAKANQ